MAAEYVGGFPATSWASLFQKYTQLLDLLKPWVSRELERFFGLGSFKAFVLTNMILDVLPVYGLDEDVLVAVLSPDLRSHMLEFVRKLREATEKECGEEAHKLLVREDCCAGSGLEKSQRASECWAEFSWWREQEEGNLMKSTTSSGSQHRGEWSVTTRVTCSARPRGWELSPERSLSPAACTLGTPEPRAAPSSSAAAADAGALPSTSTAAVQVDPACIPAPIPAEQEDAQQEPGQDVAEASAPHQGRACSRHRSCCTDKRKPSSSEDSAAPPKKLPHR